jgi:hypothetical protein
MVGDEPPVTSAVTESEDALAATRD